MDIQELSELVFNDEGRTEKDKKLINEIFMGLLSISKGGAAQESKERALGGRPRRFTESEEKAIQELYKGGKGIKTIARELRASKNTVKKALCGVRK